jgi:hypothetical protein
MFLDDVNYLVEDFFVITTISSMFSSAYHVIIAFHHIHCTVCMFTYTLASYRIAGGIASSSTGRAGLDRSAGAPGIGGVRGRGARRGAARVRRPSA